MVSLQVAARAADPTPRPRSRGWYCLRVAFAFDRPRLLVAAALFLPLVFTGALVVRYVVDVPIQDEWSLVEDLDKASAGKWGWQDLVRSHNGHRIAVPRLILVGLALASDWRADYPQFLGIVFATWILALAWRALPPSTDAVATLAAAAFLGGLVASPNQWENWLWGIQMHLFLVVLLAMAALVFLSVGPLRPRRVAFAAALTLVATLTQGAGLVLWPVGALVLAARGALAKSRVGFVLAGSWAFTGALVVLAYLARLPGDAGAGEPSGWVFHHPVAGLRFALSLVGHSLVAWNGAAYPPRDGGLAALVAALALVAGVLLARRALRGAEPGASILPLAWILWSVGVSAQIALGRATAGTPAALASRYVTLMLPFWIGLALLVLATAASWRRLALASLCVLIAGSAASEVPMFPLRHRLMIPARRALLTGEDRALIARLQPQVSQIDDGIPKLKRLGLSVFRLGEPVPIATSLPLADPRQRVLCQALPAVLHVGERRRVSVTLTNAGAEGWSSSGDGVARGYVALGTRWLGEHGELRAEGPRRRLPLDLAREASVALSIDLVVPKVAAGSYRVEISALQEGIAWFPDPAVFTVEVRR